MFYYSGHTDIDVCKLDQPYGSITVAYCHVCLSAGPRVLFYNSGHTVTDVFKLDLLYGSIQVTILFFDVCKMELVYCSISLDILSLMSASWTSSMVL